LKIQVGNRQLAIGEKSRRDEMIMETTNRKKEKP
jgi:hypothetical protein